MGLLSLCSAARQWPRSVTISGVPVVAERYGAFGGVCHQDLAAPGPESEQRTPRIAHTEAAGQHLMLPRGLNQRVGERRARL
eukprot:1893841-Rhodomonas_salina.1